MKWCGKREGRNGVGGREGREEWHGKSGVGREKGGVMWGEGKG